MPTPTASYSITVRARLLNQPGMFARVATAIGEAGGILGAIDQVTVTDGHKIREITVSATNERHADEIVQAIRKVPGVQVLGVSDRTFMMHHGGKIEITNKHHLQSRDDLSMAYTPGVARVCMAIHAEPDMAFQLTIKHNTVAIVTDGSAVLGLGDIGPAAALPVMEGKAMLFKEFGRLDAFPICLDTQDVDEIVRTVELIAPVFGGINLEDISAPRCFEIEAKLKARLSIPVFHDDQHGTAVVVLAGVVNAVKLLHKTIEALKIVISGAGAAGMACAEILMAAGAKNVILCDRMGAIYKGRSEHMNSAKEEIADKTNPGGEKGSLSDAMSGADLFIGVSGPGALRIDDVKKMAPDAILFAMANPVPEIMPEDAAPFVRVMATGRSDYPNQINNVLCFPGLFRGVLDCHAEQINQEMKLAAAYAIAGVVTDRELSEDYIIPSVFNKKVAEAVAKAVQRAANKTGVARKQIAHWKWGRL